MERSATADVAAKIHHPFMLHQSPCSVPGTRRTKATPFPVRSALAGHMSTLWLRNVMATSRTAAVRSETRIWAIDRLKPNDVCPRTCNVMMTAARCRRGSRIVGSKTGYDLPRIESDGRPARAGALIARSCYFGVSRAAIDGAVCARGSARDPLRRPDRRVARCPTETRGSAGFRLRISTRFVATPHEVSDEDVQSLKDAGHSEDEIFELTVSAAAAAGLERLDAGLRALG